MKNAIARFWSTVERFSRALIAAAVFIPLLTLVLGSWADYRSVSQQVQDEVENDRDVLHQYALSVFRTHEVIAKSISLRIQGMTWAEVQSSKDLHNYLVDTVRLFPQVHSIWISDAEGTARSTNLMFPVPFITAKQREYYHLLTTTNAAVVVAKPFMVQAGNPEEVFSVSFRLSKPDGTFNGFIGTAISTGQLAEALRTLDKSRQPGAVTSLFRDDGEILVRDPPIAASVASSYATDPELMALFQSAELGSFQRVSSRDGVWRSYAFQNLDGFPIYILRGISHATIYSRWVHNLLSYLLFFASAVIVLVLLGLYAWRQHQSLSKNAAALDGLVKARTQHLNKTLDEKTALFRETHHRVKNNLQIIASLARLQGVYGGESRDLERRIQAMALVHELLYAKAEVSNLDLKAYIESLCSALQKSAARQVDVRVDAVSAPIDLERAVPFALILTEVVTNAFKHARPKDHKLVVDVTLQSDNGHLVLQVSDNGDDAKIVQPQGKGNGFGMRLIQSLLPQLEATSEFDSSNTTTFRLRFPAKKQTIVP